MNKIFAFMVIAISGLAGGAALVINWRILALSIIAGLALILGINLWRASFGEINIDKSKGYFRIKLYPVVMIPIIALAFGAAISGLILGAVK